MAVLHAFAPGSALALALTGSTNELARSAGQNSGESLTTVADLTKTLVWPAALLFLIARFEGPILGVLDRLSKITVKAGETETTLEIEKKASTVGALVGAATAVSVQTKTGDAFAAATGAPSAGTILESASKSSSIVRQATIAKFAGRNILWVDDRPANNRFLIEAFGELQINVETALSTDEALQHLERERFDVIISDMGRPGDDRAGYTLLRALAERSDTTPVIIYAGSDSEQHRKEARAAGAIDSTNRPDRVFSEVTSILTGGIPRTKRTVSSIRGG